MFGYLVAKKNSQSQLFDDNIKRVPVTVIDSNNCRLCHMEKVDEDTVRIYVGIRTKKNVNKAHSSLKTNEQIRSLNIKKSFKIAFNQVQNINIEQQTIQLDENTIIKVGDIIEPQFFFKKDDVVDVKGKSIGKGFQGGVKRHNFAGGPKTHGQSDRERAPGSVGQTTTPGRILKGKRMAGRMGNKNITVKNLTVISANDKQLIVKGLVPGKKGNILEVILKDSSN